LATPQTEGELIDHKSDRRILSSARCGLVLADLATGINNAVRDAARVAGAGVDDHESVMEAAAMGRLISDMIDISVCYQPSD